VTTIQADERVFLAHLEDGPFLSGVDRGRWRLVSVNWPYAVIAVSAAPREGAPDEYAFRFQLTNYPETGPTAMLWDAERGAQLDFKQYPTGCSRAQMAFRTDWNGGQALYLPCDRVAIQGHEPWRTQHPSMIWSPTDNITKYLGIIYDLLNSDDYTGVRGA
jgi:hypothetical protein